MPLHHIDGMGKASGRAAKEIDHNARALTDHIGLSEGMIPLGIAAIDEAHRRRIGFDDIAKGTKSFALERADFQKFIQCLFTLRAPILDGGNTL